MKIYTGPKRIADAKVALGKWLEDRHDEDTNPGFYTGPKRIADAKIALGRWLENRHSENTEQE